MSNNVDRSEHIWELFGAHCWLSCSVSRWLCVTLSETFFPSSEERGSEHIWNLSLFLSFHLVFCSRLLSSDWVSIGAKRVRKVVIGSWFQVFHFILHPSAFCYVELRKRVSNQELLKSNLNFSRSWNIYTKNSLDSYDLRLSYRWCWAKTKQHFKVLKQHNDYDYWCVNDNSLESFILLIFLCSFHIHFSSLFAHKKKASSPRFSFSSCCFSLRCFNVLSSGFQNYLNFSVFFFMEKRNVLERLATAKRKSISLVEASRLLVFFAAFKNSTHDHDLNTHFDAPYILLARELLHVIFPFLCYSNYISLSLS